MAAHFWRNQFPTLHFSILDLLKRQVFTLPSFSIYGASLDRQKTASLDKTERLDKTAGLDKKERLDETAGLDKTGRLDKTTGLIKRQAWIKRNARRIKRPVPGLLRPTRSSNPKPWVHVRILRDARINSRETHAGA